MREYVWRWELTPVEAYRGQTFWVPPENSRRDVRVEPAPFRKGERAPLEGTDLTMLFGVSVVTRTIDVIDMRIAQPELPISGDRRSGIMFIAGARAVASYVMDGAKTYESHRIAVKESYRGRGLASRLVFEWYKRTKRPRDLNPQLLNVLAARSFLAGQREVYAWAVAHGKQVPDRVLREMETGEEEQRMLEALAEVERTKQRMTFGG